MKHYPAVSKNTPAFKKTLLALSVGALLTGCYGDQNEDQAAVSSGAEERQVSSGKLWKATRFQSSVTAQAESCANGGITINAGFDLDGNGVLDSDEIDQTQTLCNGADAAISSQVIAEGDAQACNGAGGTRLIVGSETVDICNAGQGTPAYDYVAAKSLAQGFGTWVSNLETYADDLAMSLEEQSTQINALMDGQGVDTSLTAIDFLIKTVQEAEKQNFVNTDISAVWGATLPSNIQSVTGTLTYNADLGSVVVTDFAPVIYTYFDDYPLDPNNPMHETMAATVTVDTITLPATSGTAFTLQLNNVVASTATGKVTIPAGTAAMTTTNSVDRQATTDQNPGVMTVQLDLGSETAPVRLESIGTDYGTATDKGEIVFEGNLKATVQTYEYGFAGIERYQDIAAITGAAFNGTLSYDGQSAVIALTAEVDQVTQKDTTELETVYPDLAAGNVLTGAFTVSAIDRTIELKNTRWEFEDRLYNYPPEQVLSITEYSFQRPGQSGSLYLVSFDREQDMYDEFGNYVSSGYDGNADYYRLYDLSDWDTLVTSGSYDLTSDWQFTDRVFGYYDDWDFNTSGVTRIWPDGYDGEQIFAGTIADQFSVPAVGSTNSYDLTVDWVDYPEARRSFDNHGRYIVTAQLDLNAIKAVSTTGGTLADTAIAVKAERFGYSGSLGDLQFKLDHGGESFVANYYHGDITGPWGEEDFRWEPKGFSFTDANGGLITMDDMNQASAWDCGGDYYYGNRFSENQQMSCDLGAQAFDINVNGVTHGRMWQDNNGDWIVKYKDGTEERVYTYQ